MQEIDFKAMFGIDAYNREKDGLLYKYFNVERGLSAIIEESLYFSTPEMLNDSFEFDVDKIIFDLNDDNTRSLLERHFPNNPTKREQIFESSRNRRDSVPEVMRERISEMRRKCGICCFSSNPREKKMWGSYGSSDTGVCIGFNLPPYMLKYKELFVMKVLYEEERTFINYFDNHQTMFPRLAFIKNSEWAHEQEIRAVTMNYNGLVKYDVSSIKEIYFGNKIKEDDIGRFESILALKNCWQYHRFKIQRSKTSYDLLSLPL